MARQIPLKLLGTPDSEAKVARSRAFLAMGFRPFFLLAAAFACVAMTSWMHMLGSGAGATAGLAPSLWHAHEMLFGFALAVVAGFLLTAARNWTGLDTAHGRPLAGLVGLWLAARFLMAGVIDVSPIATAAVSILFPLALLGVVGRVIVKARSRRNYGIMIILAAMTLAETAVQLDILGVLPGAARPAIYGGLHLIVTLTVVIAGRIIPLFTRNKTGVATRSIPALDALAIGFAAGVAVLAVVFSVTSAPSLSLALGVTAAISGVLQLVRMRTWGVRAALGVPMLSVLHVAYLWIAAGHLLIAAATFSAALPLTLAMHALTIGGMSTMIIGMMGRVSQGHTGREIVGGRLLTLAFVSVNLAAVARLSGVVLASHLATTWLVSGSLFVAGFAAFLAAAGRWLVTARPDGRPG